MRLIFQMASVCAHAPAVGMVVRDVRWRLMAMDVPMSMLVLVLVLSI